MIENRALGYVVSVCLDKFGWSLAHNAGAYHVLTRFEEMHPADDAERKRWEENRALCGRTSMKHFFASLIAGTTTAEHYTIQAGSLGMLRHGLGHDIAPEELLVHPAKGTAAWSLRFEGYLLVRSSSNPPSVSLLELAGPAAEVDSLGNLLDPLSVLVSGDWATQRIAELLPTN